MAYLLEVGLGTNIGPVITGLPLPLGTTIGAVIDGTVLSDTALGEVMTPAVGALLGGPGAA